MNNQKPLDVGDIQIYEDDVPNPEIQDFMNEEISRAPRDSNELRERLEDSPNSPEVSGGDIDAEWENAENDGSEAFGGHAATPEQTNVEANAEAMGFNYEDNQELDILEKIGKRDRDRFELDEDSKTTEDMI